MKGEQDEERWTEIFHAGLSDRDDPPTAAYNATSPSPRPTDESWRALKTLDAVGFNAGAEEAFLALAAALIAEGSVRVSELLQETAFELDISIATARRYLMKHTARHASLVVVGGYVQHRAPSND